MNGSLIHERVAAERIVHDDCKWAAAGQSVVYYSTKTI